jgi:exopolyphosphatase / guanosine-5'-triphosphate,3'-diphosphate pyrophosphatase
MQSGVPRWEWRTFGPSFGVAETRIRKYTQVSEQEKHDLFILSELSNDTITVRDDLLRVKTTLRQNADRLQQASAVLHLELPLRIHDLAVLYKFFGLPLPLLERNEYTRQELLDEVIKPCGWLSLAGVTTNRTRFQSGEATIDLSDVSIGGIETHTIAIRSAEPGPVSQLVKDLVLGDYKPETFIHAVKRVMDIPWFTPEIP